MKAVYVGRKKYFSKKNNTTMSEVYLLRSMEESEGIGFKPIVKNTQYGIRGITMMESRLPSDCKVNDVFEIEFGESGNVVKFEKISK